MRLASVVTDAEIAPTPRPYGDDPFAWWASLHSDVVRPIDRDGLRERDDFCAEVLGLSDELAEDADALRRFCLDAFALLPETLSGVAVPGVGDADRLALLQAAEQEVLERIARDDAPGGAR